MSQGHKRDKRAKRTWNPHYAAKLGRQPDRTATNRVRKLTRRVKLNPSDTAALAALQRALLQIGRSVLFDPPVLLVLY